MKHELAFNRHHLTGINSGSDLGTEVLHKMRYKLKTLVSRSEKYPEDLLELVELLGKMERYHAPKLVAKGMSNTEDWISNACSKTTDNFMQFMQTIALDDLAVPISQWEKELVPKQKVCIGRNKDKIHIEWKTEKPEGYKHCVTNQFLNKKEFEDTYCMPPNFLIGFPSGKDAQTGFLVQTGELDFKDRTQSFKYIDTDTNNWLRVITIDTVDMLYTCIINDKLLKGALSGFEEYTLTYSEGSPAEEHNSTYAFNGLLRIDGHYQGKERTAIIRLEKVDTIKVYKMLGVDYDSNVI